MKIKFYLFSFLISFPIISLADQENAFFNYRNGHYSEAIQELKQLAEKKNKVALYYLGNMYINGYGEKEDLRQGLELITKSAEYGYLTAQMFLGRYYLQKENNPVKALYWFQKAASLGNLDAQMYCAAAYLYGYGTKKNPNTAKDYTIQAAKNGNPIAQYALALHFLNSKNLMNKKLGLLWLNKSAKQNNPMAQRELAKMYEQGIYVEKNPQLAQQWQSKAGPEIKVNEKINSTKDPRQLAILWLSNGKEDKTFKNYNLKGILSDWNNSTVLKPGSSNLSPKLAVIKQSQIFDLNFPLTKPTDIDISEFIPTLGALRYQEKKPDMLIPRYQFPKSNNYEKEFAELSNLAMYGYAKSQFQLGQMYELGLGTKINMEQAIHWYRQAAEQEDSQAEYNLGLLYLEGNGVEKDYATALEWLTKAAFKGNAYAQYTLALLHEYGLGKQDDKNYIPKNITYAKSMYNLASSNNDVKAQYNLADLYSGYSLESTKNISEQREYHQLILNLYKSAAEHGEQRAALSLAFYYADSSNEDKRHWAFKVAEEEAAKNNKFAVILVGLMHDHGFSVSKENKNKFAATLLALLDRGLGINRNRKQALEWYHKAIEQKNPVIQFILGTYYYLGEGVRKNDAKAIELLSKASQQNFPYADYNLAIIKYKQNPKSDDFISLLQKAAAQNYSKASLALADYYLDRANNEKEMKNAADIFQDLANKGYTKAQLKLGYMYENGIYFKRDFQQAESWYLKAADQNNVVAQYLLANMYQVGKLGNPDIAKAKVWYEKAATLGFSPAKVALGFIYENVEQDYSKAFTWYQRAADDDNPLGQFNLGLMYQYGKGMEANPKKAMKWFKKSAENGFAPAIEQVKKS